MDDLPSAREVLVPVERAPAMSGSDPQRRWEEADVRYLGLPRIPEMVGRAREFVRRAALDWAVGKDTTATVELLISELVTNSVCHTAGDHVQVWVRLRGRLLFVEVHDGGPAWRLRTSLPGLGDENGGAARRLRARPSDLEAENGRGLLLVNALALRWGYRRHGGGTLTWACVAVPISQPRFI
ncbi:hypothetical protein GCM10022252_60070 [Streptosporangium oxazolinicum]|uniref:Histidine kinase/HSP90-like ATPase domain-containing protein n=1 Tax=Streptosporangium oxazolinicum TaxID=909287 RepID=A0ABP8BD57_9ACTN